MFSASEFKKIMQGYDRRSNTDNSWYIACKDNCVHILQNPIPSVFSKTQFEKAGDKYISYRSISAVDVTEQNKKDSIIKQNYLNFKIYRLITQLIFNDPPLLFMDALVFKTTINFNYAHGPAHWQSVYRFGKMLYPGIDKGVLFYFSVFHDFFKSNDFADKSHGKKALTAMPLIKENLKIWNKDKKAHNSQIEQLAFAFENHDCTIQEYASLTNPLKDNKNVRACLDADKLDLGRVGIIPESKHLLTEEAKKYNDINNG